MEPRFPKDKQIIIFGSWAKNSFNNFCFYQEYEKSFIPLSEISTWRTELAYQTKLSTAKHVVADAEKEAVLDGFQPKENWPNIYENGQQQEMFKDAEHLCKPPYPSLCLAIGL